MACPNYFMLLHGNRTPHNSFPWTSIRCMMISSNQDGGAVYHCMHNIGAMWCSDDMTSLCHFEIILLRMCTFSIFIPNIASCTSPHGNENRQQTHATMPVVKFFPFSGVVIKAKTCFASFPEFLDQAGQ